MPPPTFSEPDIAMERRADGTVLLRSRVPLGPHPATLLESFRTGAAAHPDRLLLADRPGGGDWRPLTWGAARVAADRVAAWLLARGLADRPVLVLSGNGSEHLVLMLAAWTVGAPLVPASVAYSLQSSDHGKLRAMADLVSPGLIFADDAASYGAALRAVGDGRTVVTSWPELLTVEPGRAVEAAAAAIGPDTVAKVLFTSGSTGAPKGVVTTHGMLAANQQMMAQVWPFLADEPPVLLDWLPWSHTFGGSHDLGMVLRHGGSLWVDDGRPVPALIDRTLRNMRDVSPTVYLNVPGGWAALVPHLERDSSLAQAFFARLRLGFFAAAALPQALWDRISAVAAAAGSDMAMTTSWGLTETSPASTSAHFPLERSDVLGVPLPGVELKLAPSGDKTEVRVRGPHVTPGYHGRPDLTAAAFDDEGFYRTGDAVALVDEADPGRGLLFRGRTAEDFKLMTGTFVSVGTLRPALLSACAGLLSDAVICGQDGDYVAALAWLAPDAAARPDDGLRAELAAGLARLAAAGGGSSQRVERLLLLTDPPSLDAGEITDKGYLNQRVVRERRGAGVSRLLSDPTPADVIVLA